jgi:hypothetical protein
MNDFFCKGLKYVLSLGCARGFAKVYHLAKKIMKKKRKVE